MAKLAQFMILAGLITSFSAQVYILVQAFRYSALDGLLCLVLPGYIIYYARRKRTRQTKPLLVWIGGLLFFIVGLVLFP